jgi:hypothetical protein
MRFSSRTTRSAGASTPLIPRAAPSSARLRDTSGKAIEIDDIWGIQFGQGGGANGNTNQLFFTAGNNNYGDGTFGVITFGK